ncbi:hypothetical protein [Nocardioides sp.]|uniref:nucleotidyltransferase domain-containing protein n=1 Tax=Nocardioides sp. TaxID=35761 RepID=UPI0031FEB4FF|nr:hypothetical protein [Nocardioides sp.]
MDPEDEAFYRRYGPWDPLLPGQVRGFLGDFAGPWWIVGGWAIEAFTGQARRHEDVDVVIFRRDLSSLREALKEFHLWSAGSGALRPLNDDYPDLHPEASQVWVREHALAPWVADIIVNDDHEGLWVNKRWAEHVAPLDEVTWVGDDGIRYLAPELVLLHKARLLRAKDDRDLSVTWPLLADDRRAWLLDALRIVEPGHAWIEALGG